MRVAPVIMIVGEECVAQIRPIDQYDNLIPVDRADAAAAFTTLIKLGWEKDVSMTLVPNTDLGFLEAKWTFTKVGNAEV